MLPLRQRSGKLANVPSLLTTLKKTTTLPTAPIVVTLL